MSVSEESSIGENSLSKRHSSESGSVMRGM